MLNNFKNQTGEGLIEIMIALVVAVVVLGALILIVINSLRNAQFSQNQAKATKYAQDAIEKIRTIRDRSELGKVRIDGSDQDFSVLWEKQLSDLNCSGEVGQNFQFNASDELKIEAVDCNSKFVDLNDLGLLRQILFQDGSPADKEKIVIVRVNWTDSSGKHSSDLQTILRKSI